MNNNAKTIAAEIKVVLGANWQIGEFNSNGIKIKKNYYREPKIN